MVVLRELSVFIWLSFLYNIGCSVVNSHSLPDVYDMDYLPKNTGKRIQEELQRLSPQQQLLLLQDFTQQNQQEDDHFEKNEEDDAQYLLRDIQNGHLPVIRNKRTFQFFISSLADLLGFRANVISLSSALPPVFDGILDRVDGMVKPTMAPNPTNPNLIIYPFRPAPPIPFLSFAPLPPGVVVPTLLQFPSSPTPPPCSTPSIPQQPKPVPPKVNVPSQLPLPKPRAPAHTLYKPVSHRYNSGQTNVFNTVKPHLPMSSSLYSGTAERIENRPWKEFAVPERWLDQSAKLVASDIDEKFNAGFHDAENAKDEKYPNQEEFEQDNVYDWYESKRNSNDQENSEINLQTFPESWEENKQIVDVLIDNHRDASTEFKKDRKIKRKKYPNSKESKKYRPYYKSKVKITPSSSKGRLDLKSKRKRYNSALRDRKENRKQIEAANGNRKDNRRKRDLFFDDAFRHFNLSNLDNLEQEPFPISTHTQFLDNFRIPAVEITPEDLYRQRLEKDLEKYVENYVEKQISNGDVDTKKPKTTVIKLKRKDGPPIQTVTTTVSKLIDGDKSLTDAILEYSKNINPVSNIGEFVGESLPEEHEESDVETDDEQMEKSEVSRAFENADDDFDSIWGF